eukprot:9503881-Pyramimonas_sp.AAC.1
MAREHRALNARGLALAEHSHDDRSRQRTCWKGLHSALPSKVIVDGFSRGLGAPNAGGLMRKRWKFQTKDKGIWITLQPAQCRGDHYHKEIESSPRKDAPGNYPKTLRCKTLRALTKS